MLVSEWITFLLIMALGQFSPGPDMILLTRTALAHGQKAGSYMALGIATGLMVHASIAIFLSQFLLHEISSNLLSWLQVLCAIYLLWIAYQLFREVFVQFYSGSIVEFKDQNYYSTRRSAYLRGLLCNLLNPKVALFLTAVTLPFLQLGTTSSSWPWVLWATIFLEGAVLWSIWARLLQIKQLRQFYQRASHWIDLAFGLCLLVIALMLILK